MSRVFSKKGNYWIDYKDARGVRHRKKVGPDKRIAKEILDDIMGKVARRVHLGVVEDSKIGFSDFSKIYLERVSNTFSERTRRRWKDIIEKHLKPNFQGSLRGITLGQVQAYQNMRLDGKKSTSTVNLETTVLRHMLNRAVEWEFLHENPINGIKKLKEPPGRVRSLSIEDIQNLLSTIESFPQKGHFFSDLTKHYFKSIILLALNTGMRRGEILSLKRGDLDLKNHMLTIQKTKNGESRHIYLNDVAVSALKALPPRLDTKRVFPFSGNEITMTFRRIIKKAGIDDFRFHDLRHTFCSYQAMNGVQGRGLMALMGHKDTRMTARYSHLSDSYLREAVNRMVLGGVKNE